MHHEFEMAPSVSKVAPSIIAGINEITDGSSMEINLKSGVELS